jgi:protein CpxP
MKKLLLLLAATATTSVAFAQTPAAAPGTIVRTVPPAGGLQQTPEQMVARRVQYLTEALALTPDQQTRLQPILLAQREQLQTLREGRVTNGRRYGSAQDLKAAEVKFDEQLKTVFTPEQFAKYTQLKADQAGKLPGGLRRPVRPGARPAAPAPTE